ncbi:MAG: hypothetical protein IJF78_01215 [Clostridia bacterium]|nr:hypothetical protein [Clostridia bacterium]
MLRTTYDTLLGIDTEKKSEEISASIEEYRRLSSRGYETEAGEIIDAALAKHPDSWHLMKAKMSLLHSAYYGESDAVNRKSIADTAVSIGEKILESCNDDEIRWSAVQILCHIYAETGRLERAEELVSRLPSMYVSEESIRPSLYTGSKKILYHQVFLTTLLDMLGNEMVLNFRSDEGVHQFTDEEWIAVYKKHIALHELFFENRDYGFYHIGLSCISENIAELYAKHGRNEDALAWLEKSAAHAIEFVKFAESGGAVSHTSLLFRGETISSGFSVSDSANTCAKCLKDMDGSVFNDIRSNPRFAAIREKLESRAGQWKSGI